VYICKAEGVCRFVKLWVCQSQFEARFGGKEILGVFPRGFSTPGMA
jgi:hypothetical protein